MIGLRSAAVALLVAAMPAGAEVAASFSSLQRMAPAAAESLLSEVVHAVVMAQNCPDYEVSAGEWGLLTGSGDMLAGRLGLGLAEYDRRFWRPAFAVLDRPGACGREGPKVRPLVLRLRALGGA